MTIAFHLAGARHCRNPISGPPGPQMLICGADTKPGRSYCQECHSKLYYKPTKSQMRALELASTRALKGRRF